MGRKRKVDCLKNSDIKMESEYLDDGEPGGKSSRIGEEVVRNSANERERDRMRVLSRAFTKLKTTLPWVPPDTKLSKLDTLKLASCYIAHLKHILSEDNCENSPVMAGIATRNLKAGNNNVHPMALTWPFSFNGRSSCHEDMYGDTKHLGNNKYS